MSSHALSTTRVPVSFVMGSAITLALFWGLQHLISDQVIVTPTIESGVPLFTRLTPPVINHPPRPAKPLPPPTSNPPGPGVTHLVVTVPPITGGGPGPGVPTSLFNPGTPPSQPMPTDQDAIVRVAPQPAYPEWAKTHNVEGWVLVEFTVTASGAVADPVIVDAEPNGTFDSAVLRAVSGWKYSPRVADGVAVDRPGMRVVLKFHLED